MTAFRRGSQIQTEGITIGRRKGRFQAADQRGWSVLRFSNAEPEWLEERRDLFFIDTQVCFALCFLGKQGFLSQTCFTECFWDIIELF